jgi:uncharacterized delta-60 repeat protein
VNGAVVHAIALEPDGSTIAAGEFYSLGTGTKSCIQRLSPTGTFDPNFANPIQSSVVHALALQTDGKIIAVGDFATVFGQPIKRIARLNANGTLDESFSKTVASSSWPIITAVALQKNGKIVIPNFWQTVRLNQDGSVDTSYDSAVHPDWDVTAIAISRDEKIWIGGGFTWVSGFPTMGVARLHGDVTTFLGWQTKYFAPEELTNATTAGPAGDAAGDGIPNSSKYAVGADPHLRLTLASPSAALSGPSSSAFLNFTFRKLREANDVAYEVGVSHDLQSWDFSGMEVEPVGAPLLNADGVTQEVTVRLTTPVATVPRTFLRLRTTFAP